jgi:hypothetical protein
MNFKEFYLIEKSIVVNGTKFDTLGDAIAHLSWRGKKSPEEIERLTGASGSTVAYYLKHKPHIVRDKYGSVIPHYMKGKSKEELDKYAEEWKKTSDEIKARNRARFANMQSIIDQFEDK